jgi:NACHT domain
VSSGEYRPPRRVRQPPTAGPLRLRLSRLARRLHRPLARALTSRSTQRGRRGVKEVRVWRGSSRAARAVKLVIYLGAIVFVVWVARASYAVFFGKRPEVPLDFDTACGDTSFSCDALAGTLGPLLSLALASALFLLIRLSLVRRPYVHRATEKPQDLVPTAGSIIDEVVGRDELCHVMMEDLRDPAMRRPHVVIGGVGTGKTAFLVRLTKLLAERGAVPVPVRLRDAQEDLDFGKLARTQFIADTERGLLSKAEGEKVWRQLLREGRIVVLADGLEEALIEGRAERDRDNLIRLAIRRANNDRLPLVVASRPHDPLRGTGAAIVELEPLSEEAALEYLQPRDSSEDERRLDWIVETADVAEAPLYLQITRQLHRAQLMGYVSRTRSAGRLDTRGVGRSELRLRLLHTWMNALLDGHFPPGVALSRMDREEAVEQLSALACIGLRQDRLHVRFDDFEALRQQDPPSAIVTAVDQRLSKLGRRIDMRLAANWGTELGLVEAHPEGVRFPHSIMQAYLGSRLIDVAMANPEYCGAALDNPGRELLIALIMHSRDKPRAARTGMSTRAQSASSRPEPGVLTLQDLLTKSASARDDTKALDLYAAALEIDSIDDLPSHGAIADQIEKCWRAVRARESRTLEEAKLNLVRRFGEAARAIAAQQRSAADPVAEPAYRQLYRISFWEPSHPVRHAASQEIGAGGDEAFQALRDVLGPQDPRESAGPRLPGKARNGLAAKVRSSGQEDDPDAEERRWREDVTRAWLAPMLVGSVARAEGARVARENLEQWLELVGTQDDRRAALEFRLSCEVALAQGFKYAANRRDRHPHSEPEARAYLAEQAKEMLTRTHFWFTRLTLVHALCLWALPDDLGGRQSGGGRDRNHRALVGGWIPDSGGRSEHPFVVEARRLAVWALETGQPERFIWIDESGVLGRVGSRPAVQGVQRKHNLWIPPSTGWTVLHPHAQQLLADVLLLLNLARRGRRPSERDRRLQRTNRNFLPPCLAGDRTRLDPTRTVGMALTSEPGSNCEDGCTFELCPYPPKDEANYRIELTEAFCRRQQVLVSGAALRRRAAPWQGALPADLRRFWRQLGQPPQHVETNGRRGPGRRRRSRLAS